MVGCACLAVAGADPSKTEVCAVTALFPGDPFVLLDAVSDFDASVDFAILLVAVLTKISLLIVSCL